MSGSCPGLKNKTWIKWTVEGNGEYNESILEDQTSRQGLLASPKASGTRTPQSGPRTMSRDDLSIGWVGMLTNHDMIGDGGILT